MDCLNAFVDISPRSGKLAHVYGLLHRFVGAHLIPSSFRDEVIALHSPVFVAGELMFGNVIAPHSIHVTA